MIQFRTIGITRMAMMLRAILVTAVRMHTFGGMVSDTFMAGEVRERAGHALHGQHSKRKHQHKTFGPVRHKRPKSIGEPWFRQSTHWPTTPA